MALSLLFARGIYNSSYVTYNDDLQRKIVLTGAPIVNVVFYIVMLVFGALCISNLSKCLYTMPHSNASSPCTISRRYTWFYTIYVVAMLCLGTMFMICLQFVVAQGSINPTGVSDPYAKKSSITAYGIYNTSFAVIGFLADALVVWRCCVVYQETFLCWYVGVACWLLYAGDLALGLSSDIAFSIPSPSGLSDWTSIVLARVAICISASLNVICTALIVGRLYSVKRYFSNMMGSSVQSKLQYTTISAMLIESCALYAIMSLTFLVLWLLASPFAVLVAVMYGECQVISVFLVILRVSKGIAWSNAVDSNVIADLHLTSNLKHDQPDTGPGTLV